MEYPVCVEVGDSRDKLEKECFRFGGKEGFGHIFKEGAEVMFEEVEDKKYAMGGCVRFLAHIGRQNM